MITTLMRLIFSLKVLFWGAVIIFAYVYSVEIGGFFTGAAARFDHLIGYTEVDNGG